MSAVVKGIRWVLVPASAVAVVGVVIAAARWAVSLVDARCPPESMVGGACAEPWHTTAVEAAIYAAVAMAALGVVTVPSLLAPHLKRSVSVVGFVLVIAAAVAAYALMTWPVMLPPLGIALVSGALALWWTWRRNPSREAA